jgi:hypothetical protein
MGDFVKDGDNTKEQLVHERSELRSQNAVLEKSITGNISDELVVESRPVAMLKSSWKLFGSHDNNIERNNHDYPNFFRRVHGHDYEDHHKDLRSDKAGFT